MINDYKLSIITTMYYSAPYVEVFYSRMRNSALALTDDIEFVFVNDGSPDDSLEIVLKLRENDPSIKVIDLSRNFGQHKAIMTGLDHTTGDYVFLLDCDLEIAPESLQDFFESLHRDEAIDVVYGVQETRKDPWLNQFLSQIYYRVFNFFSGIPIPANLLVARLMSRRYVDALLQHREQVMIIAGLWANTGFKQVPFTIKKSYKGSSTYNFRRKISMMVNSIVVFSNKPLIYISILGFLMTLGALIYVIWLLFSTIFLGYGIEGWNSLIVSIWLVGGINIFVLGIIALYLAVIFSETKDRPYTIIREIYD